MPLTTVIPALATAAAILVGQAIAMGDLTRLRGAWVAPAAVSFIFAVFSVITIVLEGPLGFWSVHTMNLWGNQVWIDLLLAVLISLAAITPTARRLGMRPGRWFPLILATGSIALLAMVARLLYLREQAGRSAEPR